MLKMLKILLFRPFLLSIICYKYLQLLPLLLKLINSDNLMNIYYNQIKILKIQSIIQL